MQVLWDVTLGLFCGVSSGEDIRLSISEVLTSRTFCNKMWQTLRFTLGVLGDNTTPLRTLEEVHQNRLVLLMKLKLRHDPGFRPSEELRKLLCLLQTAPLSSMDQWICSRLYSTVVQCEVAFQASELHVVTSALRSFWVHSLCDVYLVSMAAVGTRARQDVE